VGGIIRGIYKWSCQNFDLDYDIMALLTNEHIAVESLAQVDQSFHLDMFSDEKKNQ